MPVTGVGVGAAVLMFTVLMPAYLHTKQGGETIRALILKGLCTLMAVLLCLVGAWQSGTADSWWMVVGLSLCLVGDVVLGIQFVGGVCAFLLGHLCYITAFLNKAPFSLWSITAFIGILMVIIRLFYRFIKKMGNLQIPLCIYATVISAMLSIAIILPFTIGKCGFLPAAGAALFVLSDLLLLRNMLVQKTQFSDSFSLTCYYLGQYLLALSVFMQ